MPFDRSSTRSRGRADAGLLIHEGQLTYGADGLQRSSTSASGGCSRRAAAAARRQRRAPRPRRGGAARAVRRCSRRRSAPGSTTARRRSRTRMQFGRGLDDGAGRPLRGDVRQRADLRLRRRGPAGGAGAARPRRGARASTSDRSSRLRRLRPRLVTSAVVLSAVRTPVGRYGGALSGVRPDDLGRARDRRGGRAGRRRPRARSRTSTSAARTRRARTTATSRAWARCSPGLPQSVAGVTVNRLCASGLSAVVGGVPRGRGRRRRPLRRRRRRVDEPRAARARPSRTSAFPRGDRTSTTRRSAGASRTRSWRRCSRSSRWARPARTSPSGGASRARSRTRSRLQSQQPLGRRGRGGRFADELVPVGDVVRDEHPRPGTTAEKLAR